MVAIPRPQSPNTNASKDRIAWLYLQRLFSLKNLDE